MKTLLVRTKLSWSWAGEPVFIVKNVSQYSEGITTSSRLKTLRVMQNIAGVSYCFVVQY